MNGSSDAEKASFRVHKESLSGAAGALVMVGGILILVRGVPSLRWPFLVAIVLGGVFGGGLFLFRRRY